MKRYIFTFVVLGVSMGGAMAQGDPIWFHFGPNYLCYSYPMGTGGYVEEVISFNQGTETVEGKEYYVANVKDWKMSNSGEMPESREWTMHIRENCHRILVRYDEYKKLMEGQGYEMTDFDCQCRYEVTTDDELILYDFNIQVGDKFRSVPGKEDVYVVDRYKETAEYHTSQDTLDVIKLSNGCRLLAGIGYKSISERTETQYPPNTEPRGNFFDYLNLDAEHGTELMEVKQNYEYIWVCALDGPSAVALPQVEKEQSPFFDLQGRRLTGKPTKGIYIQNGRKVLVK